MRNLFALALTLYSLPAFAQDDLSEDVEAPSASESRRRARVGADNVAREIVRGYYVKSAIGSTVYAPVQGVQLGGVMAVGLGMGSDFIDRERFSASWEIELAQGLFNGPPTPEQVKLSGPVVQGDIHTVGVTGAVEASLYVSRRLGIGARGGGGVVYAPLLVTQSIYDSYRNEWGGANATFHAGTLPMALVGATLEYYTKLSHFSIGADADLNVLFPSVAVSVRPVGYLKYTF
jgi:hypothetical protein